MDAVDLKQARIVRSIAVHVPVVGTGVAAALCLHHCHGRIDVPLVLADDGSIRFASLGCLRLALLYVLRPLRSLRSGWSLL